MDSTPPLSERWLAGSTLAVRSQFALQLLLGFWLWRGYSPEMASAHADVAAMHTHSGEIERILQGMHYWGSALLILHALLHTLIGVWVGWYKSPNSVRFLETALESAIAIGFQVTGNVLPLDRHGAQTAAIESSVLARAPIVGPGLSHALLGGDSFSSRTPAIWFQLHSLVLPAVLIVVVLLALWRYPGPKLDRSFLVGSWAWLPILVVIALIFPSPLGSTATPADFNSFDARASWYVWPIHGSMRMFDTWFSGGGWIGAFLLPGLFGLYLCLLPVVGKRASPTLVRGIGSAFLLVFGFAALVYGGQFAPLTGTRDPATALAGPSARSSPIDKVLAARGRSDFNQLPCSGCHGTDGAKGNGGPVLTKVWQKYSDAGYYEKFIANPTAVQPNSTMPPFPKLSPGQLQELAEFLRSPK